MIALGIICSGRKESDVWNANVEDKRRRGDIRHIGMHRVDVDYAFLGVKRDRPSRPPFAPNTRATLP